MEFDWNTLVEQIKANDRISKKFKEQFIKSVTVLRRELGEDWLKDTSHPLLWRMQNMYGNPSDWFVVMLAENITALKEVVNFESILNRVRLAGEYSGAVTEIEVGGTLARHGYDLTIEPEQGKKKPDFFCEKDGCEFLVEVKTLMVSEEIQNANRISQRIIAACNPIFPAGVILNPLLEHLLVEIECKLKEVVGRVTVETAQEFYRQNALKLYLVDPNDPNRIKKNGEWCRKQERLGIFHACAGLAGPPVDLTDHSSVRFRILGIKREEQIPQDKMGILFIFGSFIIRDTDVEEFVDGIIKEVHELGNIPAVVLVGAKTTTLSQEAPKIIKKGDYIDIDCCLAPHLKEKVLIVKNRFCRFPFDYDMLTNMYTETIRN